MRRPYHHESGAALILVLGLISIMSTAAVFSFDSISRLIKRNMIEQELAQARHYAIAAEHIGIKQMRDVINQNLNFGLIMAQNLNRYDYVIDDARLSVVAEDVSNCFNVHALVEGTNITRHEAAPDGMRRFADFLQVYGIGRETSQSMSAALADWQDSDTIPLPGGAESGFYAERNPAYRTADAPVADISELRLVVDYNEDLLNTLGELICAGNIDNEIRLNVATLQPRHAPLLTGLLGNAVALPAMEAFLAETRLGKFDDVGAFFKSPIFADQPPSAETQKLFKSYPSRIRLLISADYGDAKLRLVTEVRFNSNGTYAIISRKFGV